MRVTLRGTVAALSLLSFFGFAALLMVEAVLITHTPQVPFAPHTGNADIALLGVFLSAVVAVFAFGKARS